MGKEEESDETTPTANETTPTVNNDQLVELEREIEAACKVEDYDKAGMYVWSLSDLIMNHPMFLHIQTPHIPHIASHLTHTLHPTHCLTSHTHTSLTHFTHAHISLLTQLNWKRNSKFLNKEIDNIII